MITANVPVKLSALLKLPLDLRVANRTRQDCLIQAVNSPSNIVMQLRPTAHWGYSE